MDNIIKIAIDVDVRTQDWFLVDAPKTVFSLIFAYILWTKVLGPKYMKNKKPYDIKLIVNLYNIFQFFACLYLVNQFVGNGAFDANILDCKPSDFSHNTDALYTAKLMWMSFLLKGIDLIETIIFSLRKKWNQISFLHLYHHTMTFLVVWISARYHPGGYFAQILCSNHLVHCIMYLYYTFAANASAKTRKRFITFKKIVTLIQLIQFTFFICWGIQSFFVERCSTEKNVAYYFVPYSFSLFYLFSVFYIKTYLVKVRHD